MWRGFWFSLLCLQACEEQKAGDTRALKDGLAAAEAAAKVAPLTRSDVDTTERLRRVLARRFADHVGSLGGIEQKLEATYEISSAGEPEVRLRETLVLRVDATGQYDLVHRNSYWSREDQDGEDGRGCRWVEGRFFTSRLHGLPTEVPVRAAEQQTCLDSAIEPVVGMMQIALSGLDVSPTGRIRVAGRDAVKVVFLQRSDSEAAAKAIPEAWRTPDSKAIWGPRGPLLKTYAAPEQATGDLSLDAETGVVLSGRLQAKFALRKSDRSATLEVRMGLSVERFTGTITAPEESRRFEARQRVFADREALRGKIEKPVDRSAALPKPGDAPPLRLGPDERAGDAEDRPGQDEDAPR
jgi:hypothetical protein